jgi:hypothetical protein
MFKDHHGMLGETTTITQQVAQDKDTCHKSPKHKQPPPIKVDEHSITCPGRIVLLYN